MLKQLSLALGIICLSSVSLSAVSETDIRLATITSLKNNVELKYSTSDWRPGRVNQLVRPGTSIRTGSLSKVEIKYPDGTITRIGGRTNLTVLDKSIRAVKIDSGKMWFKVAKRSSGYRIYSPTAVAAITGTEGFAQYGEVESGSTRNNMFASSDKIYKVAEDNQPGFSTGLVEGSMDVYGGYDSGGNPTGNPNQLGPGQILTMLGNSNFQYQNVPIDQIINQYNDISQGDISGNNNSNNNNNNSSNNNNNNQGINNQNLGPTNPVTEQIPGTINKQQEIINSPTTGDLEIIIK